jgi:hypothetical protein
MVSVHFVVVCGEMLLKFLIKVVAIQNFRVAVTVRLEPRNQTENRTSRFWFLYLAISVLVFEEPNFYMNRETERPVLPPITHVSVASLDLLRGL